MTDAEGVAVIVWPVEAEGVGVGVGGAKEAVGVRGEDAQDQPAFVKAGGSAQKMFSEFAMA